MKIILILTGLFVSLFSYSQVAINTNNAAMGVFHVDAKGDTDIAGNHAGDDMIISSNGNVGIGTIPSSAYKLDVKGSMKIVTGNEGSKRMWICVDENGLGDWKYVPPIQLVRGTIPATHPSIPIAATTQMRYMQVHITLTSGDWQVYYTAILNNNINAFYTTWWDLATSGSSLNNSTRVGRVLGYSTEPGVPSVVYCTYRVSVPTGTSRTFYLWACSANAKLANGSGATGVITYNSGARIWAVPVQ